MKDILLTVLFIGVIFVGLPFLIIILKDKIWKRSQRRKNPPEKVQQERKEHEEKIKNPDWIFYERYLQRPVPKQLKSLFEDKALIVSGGFDYDDTSISSFEAIHEENLLGEDLGFNPPIVPIAFDEFGDSIYLKPGAKEDNILYITYHDGGDTEVFEASLDEFVRKVRRSLSVASANGHSRK
jgi:hypothetical protein